MQSESADVSVDLQELPAGSPSPAESPAESLAESLAESPPESLAHIPVDPSPSWILVEDEELPRPLFATAPRTNTYRIIQDHEVIGGIDLTQNKVRFMVDGVERRGVMHLISTDRKFVECELEFMVMESSSPEFPECWALVNHGEDEDKIRIAMVGCKKTKTNDPHKQGLLLAMAEDMTPYKLLQVLKSEQELRVELKFLQDLMIKMTMCEEKDSEVEAVGLENAYLLVQYFEDALNLVFTIVRYQDTMWKEDNHLPGVVAYIGTKELAHQCIILRKSFDFNELVQILNLIRRKCNDLRNSHFRWGMKSTAFKCCWP